MYFVDWKGLAVPRMFPEIPNSIRYKCYFKQCKRGRNQSLSVMFQADFEYHQHKWLRAWEKSPLSTDFGHLPRRWPCTAGRWSRTGTESSPRLQRRRSTVGRWAFLSSAKAGSCRCCLRFWRLAWWSRKSLGPSIGRLIWIWTSRRSSWKIYSSAVMLELGDSSSIRNKPSLFHENESVIIWGWTSGLAVLFCGPQGGTTSVRAEYWRTEATSHLQWQYKSAKARYARTTIAKGLPWHGAGTVSRSGRGVPILKSWTQSKVPWGSQPRLVAIHPKLLQTDVLPVVDRS